jgi:hypothetical protein
VITGRHDLEVHVLETKNTGDSTSKRILPADSENNRNLLFAYASVCFRAQLEYGAEIE